MPINSLNLSLCDQCMADCVFCPKKIKGSSKWKVKTSHMPFPIVQKVIDEISSDDFPWEVKTIQVGENGDTPLHKNFISILRYIRDKMPGAFIDMATNFSAIDHSELETILNEGLLNGIHVNIDGHNAETYYGQKRLLYEHAINAIKDFLELRDNSVFNIKLSVSVITLRDYIKTILNNFGELPYKLEKISHSQLPLCSYGDVVQSLHWLPDDVYIRKAPIFGWAERHLEDIDMSALQCPQLPRVENEAFISPTGNWYPCCLDDKYDQAYGNIMDSSLVELHNSEKRLQFIGRLKAKQFEEVGYPCNKLWSCQVLPQEKK